MINLKKALCFAIVLLSTLTLTSCSTNKQVDALVIIVGRHANANAFDERFYEVVKEYLEKTVFGGYIAMISTEGTPRQLEIFDYFQANEQNKKRQKRQIEDDTELVLGFLKREEQTRAITPENDLLRAIRLASSFLNDFEIQAKREGKTIGKKRIVIMNTGIVTAGSLDFSTLEIENFDFSVSNDGIKDFATEIAEKLNANRALPDLNGVSITFVGLGDVAQPQRELSDNVREGLKILWETILNKANAQSFHSRGGTISTGKANDILITRNNDTIIFPQVRPIEFLENTGWTIDNEQLGFVFGGTTFRNPEEARNNLRRFANIITRYVSRRPDVIIYVVGSESKDQDRSYTPRLSEERAKTVMDMLTSLGVPRNKMQYFGLAVCFPERENDRPNNVFDPEVGKRNQKVVLIPSDIGRQEFLKEVLSVKNRLYERGRCE
jgi:outer membrane protein OmpA-like peptidoglycan-associated protein